MKFFAAIFVALLAVHASTQSPIQDDSIKTVIVEALQTVLNATGPLLTEVEQLVADFEANEDEATQKIVDSLVTVFSSANHLLIEGIDMLKDDASDDSVAALECIDAQENNTNAAALDALTQLGACVSNDYGIIFTEVDKIVAELQSLQDDVQEQVDTLSSCEGLETLCLVTFATTIADTIKAVVAALEVDVPDVYDLVKQVLEDIHACNIAPSIKAHAVAILDAGVACIKSS